MPPSPRYGRFSTAAAELASGILCGLMSRPLFFCESRDTEENFSARFAAALRKQFGGHKVHTSDVTRKAPEARLDANGSSS